MGHALIQVFYTPIQACSNFSVWGWNSWVVAIQIKGDLIEHYIVFLSIMQHAVQVDSSLESVDEILKFHN